MEECGFKNGRGRSALEESQMQTGGSTWVPPPFGCQLEHGAILNKCVLSHAECVIFKYNLGKYRGFFWGLVFQNKIN